MTARLLLHVSLRIRLDDVCFAGCTVHVVPYRLSVHGFVVANQHTNLGIWMIVLSGSICGVVQC
jgi:hypothetical protein